MGFLSPPPLEPSLVGAAPYFLTGTASDIGGYKAMTATVPVGVDANVSAVIAAANTAIEEWITPLGFPNVAFIPSGVWHVHCHGIKTAGTKDAVIYVKFYTRTAGGLETLIGTSEDSIAVTTTETDVEVHAAIGDLLVTATDRIVAKFFASPTGAGTNPTIAIHYLGTTASRIELPTGIIEHGSLAGLGDDDHTQYALADGTRGKFWNYLAEYSLVADTASVTFNGLPATYDAFVLQCYATTDYAAGLSDNVKMQFNGDTGANYATQYVSIFATNVSAGELLSQNYAIAFQAASVQAPANRRSGATIFIPGYASNQEKSSYGIGASMQNTIATSGGLVFGWFLGHWNSTSAITSILLAPILGANFKAGSTIRLYGIPKA